MVVRVVLGGTPLGRRFARQLATWPGELFVLVDDETVAERLREDGIAATETDTSDVSTLADVVPPPDVVIVASDDPDDATTQLQTVADAYPSAHRILISENSWSVDEELAQLHIPVGDYRAIEIAEMVSSQEFLLTMQLLRATNEMDPPVAVVMHDNPDPDAIAAAVGMVHLSEMAGHEAIPLYAGEITHQENRAFVNLLELELETYERPLDIDEYGSIVLVDHAHPGVNDQLPPAASIDIIIDHHPAREEAEARFVDRRHDVGATSTLVADHLYRAQIEPKSTLASALWYGIHVDTDGFRRGVASLDFERAAWLRQWVDVDMIGRIESPRMTAQTLETIGRAIDNRSIYDDVLITGAGAIAERDALAQAADELQQMAGISTVLVYGHIEEIVYASARSLNDNLDVGDAIRLAFGQIGNAGGHEDMAGAQIPIGMLRPGDADDTAAALAEVVADRFLEGIELATRPLPSGYHDSEVSFN